MFNSNFVAVLFILLGILALLLSILLNSCPPRTTGTTYLPDPSGTLVPVPLYFETNDLLQTTADLSNVIEIFGNNANSTGDFKQRLSGILTTVDSTNRVTIRNQRDVTSYVVGDPSYYDAQFTTIQAAIDQAIADGVDVSATPARQAQILVKAGDYSGNILIPRHGISIFGLTNGRDRIVRILGTLTISPQDSSAKTLINIKNMVFEGSTGVPAIIITSSPSFNPKVLCESIFTRDGRSIICNALPVPVELTLYDSIVEDINLNGICSLLLQKSSSQGFITVLNAAGSPCSITLQNNSIAQIITDDTDTSNFTIFSEYSQFSVSGHRNPSTKTSVQSHIRAIYSELTVDLGFANDSISGSNLSFQNCIGSVTLGQASDPVPQGRVEFDQCIFKNLTLHTIAPLSTNITTMLLNKCTWNRSGSGANWLSVHDYSTIAHGAPYAIKIESDQCQYLSSVLVSGINVEMIDTQSYHDLSAVSLSSPLAIYSLEDGARLVPYLCVYKLKDLTDFVIIHTLGAAVDWVRSTATVGGVATFTQTNYISNVGSGPANYTSGAVNILNEGNAIL